MTVPMIILAIGSVGAGAFLAIGDRLMDWLAPSVGSVRAPGAAGGADRDHHRARWRSSALGVFLAYWIIGRRAVPVDGAGAGAARSSSWPARTSAATRSTRRSWPGRGSWLTRTLVFTDAKGVDGAVNGLAAALGGLSGRWRRWQNGFVRSYALSMFAGALAVVLLLVLVRFA